MNLNTAERRVWDELKRRLTYGPERFDYANLAYRCKVSRSYLGQCLSCFQHERLIRRVEFATYELGSQADTIPDAGPPPRRPPDMAAPVVSAVLPSSIRPLTKAELMRGRA